MLWCCDLADHIVRLYNWNLQPYLVASYQADHFSLVTNMKPMRGARGVMLGRASLGKSLELETPRKTHHQLQEFLLLWQWPWWGEHQQHSVHSSFQAAVPFEDWTNVIVGALTWKTDSSTTQQIILLPTWVGRELLPSLVFGRRGTSQDCRRRPVL